MSIPINFPRLIFAVAACMTCMACRSISQESMMAAELSCGLLDGPDGMVIAEDGSIYIANWGRTGQGRTVVRISGDGQESIHADDLAAPDGLALDDAGNLYVSCYDSGEIWRLDASGMRQRLASGIHHPSALALDEAGNLYVSVLGDYDGTTILRIAGRALGTLGDEVQGPEVFATGLIAPLGLAFDDHGLLYVSSYVEGSIHRVGPDGQATLFVQLPARDRQLQYLAFDDDGNLYCPSYGDNCIYRVDASGAARVMEISIRDEEGRIRIPNGPNSIAIHEGWLYFTEFNTDSLFRVRLPR